MVEISESIEFRAIAVMARIKAIVTRTVTLFLFCIFFVMYSSL